MLETIVLLEVALVSSAQYVKHAFQTGNQNLNIKNHNESNNMLEVSVDFVSEIISCVKDKDKKIVSGNPEKIKKVYDTWKFSRDIRSQNPNWLLVDTQA